MPSFRLLNQAPQYLLRTGLVNAGGSLRFFENDLSTPKATWSDEAMTVLNTNPVTMDSAGRTQTDVWGDGTYGVIMADRDGVEQWTRNDVQASAGTGTALPDPAGHAGEYLLSNGSTYVLEEKYELPDPTGLNNYQLVSDGSGWIAQQIVTPVVTQPDIVVAAKTVRIAQGAVSFYLQSDTASAPNSGSRSTSVSVVYATPFVTTFGAPSITPTGSTYSTFGNQPSWTLTSNSTTGFTVKFTMGELDDNQSGYNFNTAVPFGWVAFGTIATP